MNKDVKQGERDNPSLLQRKSGHGPVVVIPLDVICSDISSTAKILFGLILSNDSNMTDSYRHVNVNEAAAIMGINPSNVRRALSDLENVSLLRKVGRGVFEILEHAKTHELDEMTVQETCVNARTNEPTGEKHAKTHEFEDQEAIQTQNFSPHSLYQEHQEQERYINHQEQSITQKHQQPGQPKDSLTERVRKTANGKDDLPNDDFCVLDEKTDQHENRPTGSDASPGTPTPETADDPSGNIQAPKNAFLHVLRKLLGSTRFDLWFVGVRTVAEESLLTIFAKNKFVADQVRNKFKQEIEQAVMESFEPAIPWRVLADDSPPRPPNE